MSCDVFSNYQILISSACSSGLSVNTAINKSGAERKESGENIDDGRAAEEAEPGVLFLRAFYYRMRDVGDQEDNRPPLAETQSRSA